MTYVGMFDEIDLSHKFRKVRRDNRGLKKENRKLKKRVEELDNSLSIALEVNDKYQREKI